VKVLALTRSDDNRCVEDVRKAVAARGGKLIRLDTDRFPSEVVLRSALDPASATVEIEAEGERCVLAELAGVWHRRIAVGQALPATMEPDLLRVSRQESRAALLNAVAVGGTFVLDPLHVLDPARNKDLQLRVARSLGLDVPRTLTTNDPRAARAFWDECRGEMVTKMLSSFALEREGREQVVFTSAVRAQDLGALDELRLCPMVFQERLPKAHELRVTVVGTRVFSASIDSQSRPEAKVDWRKKGNEMVREWREAPLPAEVERKVLALMDAFALNYGALDFVVTPDGRHVFLEVNPVGEFFWLEEAPGFPISEALADVLLGRAPRRTRPVLGSAAFAQGGP
jgi:glutathione synthase/RimK-type ligase-like ATP-grasp enzyme